MGLAIAIGIALVVVAGALWLNHHLAEQRRRAFSIVASRYQLRYYPTDPFDTLTLPFAAFQRGHDRKVQNVLVGLGHDGREVRAFDYQYTTGSGDSQQHWRRSVVLSHTGGCWPHVQIKNEGFATRLADKLGFRDLELESEEFNHRFQVNTSDARFGTALLDPQMMHALLGSGIDDAFEIGGPWMLEIFQQVPPDQLVRLVQRSEHLRAAIPKALWRLYPHPPASPPAPPAPPSAPPQR